MAHNSRSLSARHDTSARARAHQHPNRKRHGVQQKECLSSSETTWLHFQHVIHLTAGIAPRNGGESPAETAASVERPPSRGRSNETCLNFTPCTALLLLARCFMFRNHMKTVTEISRVGLRYLNYSTSILSETCYLLLTGLRFLFLLALQSYRT